MLRMNSIIEVTRTDNGDGTFAYAKNGATYIDRSKVRYTHASTYSASEGDFVKLHKSANAAANASDLYCAKIGYAEIKEVSR